MHSASVTTAIAIMMNPSAARFVAGLAGLVAVFRAMPDLLVSVAIPKPISK